MLSERDTNKRRTGRRFSRSLQKGTVPERITNAGKRLCEYALVQGARSSCTFSVLLGEQCLNSGEPLFPGAVEPQKMIDRSATVAM